jgi:hypothetical protein
MMTNAIGLLTIMALTDLLAGWRFHEVRRDGGPVSTLPTRSQKNLPVGQYSIDEAFCPAIIGQSSALTDLLVKACSREGGDQASTLRCGFTPEGCPALRKESSVGCDAD